MKVNDLTGHGVYKHLEFGRLRAPSPAAIAHRQPAKRTSSAMVPIFKCDEWVHAKMPLDTPFDAEWSCANVSKCQQRTSLVVKRPPR